MIGAILFTAFVHSALAAEKVTVPASLSQRLKTFEPSGIIYLPDLDQYLVASDDTDKKNSPLLFLMDKDGDIDKDPIVIEGIEKLTDIESLSQDSEGNIFILSSLSLNRTGKNLKERNMLIQARLQGRKISIINSVELRPLLLKALENSCETELVLTRGRFEKELNVEASFVKDGILYVGLKSPQPEVGQALILSLGPLKKIFSNKILDLKLLRIIEFASISSEGDLLSDMIFSENNLILSTTNSRSNGRLWAYDLKSEELSILSEFEGLNSEGLALSPDSKDLMIVFDQDNSEPLYTHFKMQ